MAQTVIMPKAGMSMTEGKIIKWLKSEGDKVEKGDALLEIETDKTNMEVEAEYSGVLLKILKHEGQMAPVTEVIAMIGTAGENIQIPQKEEVKNTIANTAEVTQTIGYDVVVVGGGPAGYVAAIKAAQLGGKVALIEKDTVGGTCLNRGCIPTKTYLKSAQILQHILTSAYRGIQVDAKAVSFNIKEALKNKNDVVKRLTGGVASLLKSNGVDVIKGSGVVTAPGMVKVNDKKIISKTIIYAGGSVPGRIGIPGIDSKLVWTSDEILDTEEIPARLAIIGGGVIGVELGMAFAQFGSKVTIIEMMDRIVPNMDDQISELLKMELEKQGIKVLNSVGVTEIIENGDELKLKLNDGTLITADRALLSIGRKPDLYGIESLGVTMEKGRVKVNDRMETSVANVYAPGDINGLCMLAHAAFKMGEVAAENAMGGDVTFNNKNVPGCIYTFPEVGAIGYTEKEAAKLFDIKVGRFPFSANGRALASGEGDGFVKVISDKKYGEILGIHIVGPNAAEMINEAAVLMSMEATDEDVADITHGHPTYSEALMEAAADSAGRCIHQPRKK